MIEKKDKLKLCAVSVVLLLVSGYLSTKVTDTLETIKPHQDNWQRVETFVESGSGNSAELSDMFALSVQSKRASDAALSDLLSVFQWLGIALLIIAVIHVVVVVGLFQRNPGVGPTGKSSD